MLHAEGEADAAIPARKERKMDPVTTALIAAIGAGALKGVGDVGSSAITDAYNGLKSLIRRKTGADGDVVDAVDRLEKKPDSDNRRGVLQEEIAATGLDKDPEVRSAAEKLLEQIKAQPGGEQHIQQAIGSYIAVADRSSTASVNVNQPKA
jgi:hypothetical protein